MTRRAAGTLAGGTCARGCLRLRRDITLLLQLLERRAVVVLRQQGEQARRRLQGEPPQRPLRQRHREA